MDADHFIAAEDLAGGYQDNVLFRDAQFTVGRGEFVAVIGPNGAGKTTLFRLLLGLQPPIRGSLTVFGEHPHRGNPRIGYVPQRHAIDSDLSVEALEMVRLSTSGTRWGPDLFSREERVAAMAALESVGAGELAHRSLGRLSGGELQRVFLASALAGNPDLLLLDEPLSNLDMRRERNLVGVINDVVRAKNTTVLLIAHNINPLLPYLDKVIYIANGRVASGTPKEVLTSASLSALFQMPVEVHQDRRGNIAVIGIEENQAHCE